MDLRNLCSEMRAKIPHLPQIKLPKSMSKLKSRKIFRSSREDVNSMSRHVSSKRITPVKPETLPLPFSPQYTIPSSEFINRTPTKISTISSLMKKRDGSGGQTVPEWRFQNEEDETSYHNAGGIDDYYPSPLSHHFEQRLSRPISPVKAPPNAHVCQEQPQKNVKMSFAEKLQKGYKDVNEFKFKHLFAKRTIVHKDNIDVTEYVQRYDEDRRREQRIQEKIDKGTSDNYRFQFKVSKQNSNESYGSSPTNSPKYPQVNKAHMSLSELSDDESGMESSPPKRKPGIASTRFPRMRSTPLSMSLEEDNDSNDSIENIQLDQHDVADTPKCKPNTSSLHNIKESNSPVKSSKKLPSSQTSKSIRERIGRLTKQKSEGDVCKAVTEKKRKAPLSPQQSEDEIKENNSIPTKSEKSLDAIKHNFKRLQKSIKLPQQISIHAGTESENDEANPNNKAKLSRSQQFTERLKRFRSSDHINKNPEDDNNESPINKITNKFQEWKKSIKKKSDSYHTDNDEGEEGNSPQKLGKPVESLMKKLKHIKSRKQESADDPDEDEEGGGTYKESLSARAKLQLEKGVVAASLMPQKTMQKISETKKYFKKKPDADNKTKSEKSKSDDEHEEKQAKTTTPPAKTMPRPPPPIPRTFIHYSSDEEGNENREQFIKKSIIEAKQIAIPAARTAWTTKPMLSDDTTDYDDELPRVLIHQDNSDIFESTLIIAVTRPRSHTTTPFITELPPNSTQESTLDTKPDNWISNEDMVATFLDMTPPSQQKLSKDSNNISYSTGHSRKHSIESSSDDSWIKDIPRGPSIAPLNSVYKNEEPWKIQRGNKDENLYKAKSIDLFEMQKEHGGVLTAFEDFDDELKNTPVVKIEQGHKILEIIKSKQNSERESSEELDNPYDDNSSRVTKISAYTHQNITSGNNSKDSKLKSKSYGNSQESLTGNLDNKNAIDSGAEDDNEESEQDEYNYNQYETGDYDERDKEFYRPTSKTPSPPSSISPPPPPLPQRQPSIWLSKLSQPSEEIVFPVEQLPPLPQTKPPLLPNRPARPPPPPPKIPDRTHISKPLVKTASLRLAYSEQVSPEDVGKVNKLISRFEPEGPKQKPLIISRKLIINESEDSGEEEDSIEIVSTSPRDRFKNTILTKHPLILTKHPLMQKSYSIDSADIPNNNITTTKEITDLPPHKATSQIILNNSGSATTIPTISISSSCQDINFNFSQPSSVYGSPLPYSSSLIGSTEVTPLTDRKDSQHFMTRRNRRYMARDDDNFYSFDSDDENSYYSISSNNSNRYVVEL